MWEITFKKSNLRAYEYIVAYAYCLINLIHHTYSYYGTYNNYFTIIMHVLKRKFPVEAVLRKDKTRIILHSHVEAFFFTLVYNRRGIYYDIENNMITFSPIPHAVDAKMSLKLYGGITNGDIFDTFLKNTYRFLPVKGKIVVDIGANIGDTAIYFALHGASKIIALEPYPRNYELAKKNIEANIFSDKIVILLAGCAAKRGNITIDPNKSDIFGSIVKSEYGIEIPLLTLEDVLNEYGISEAILKIDCEGCEYEVILSASDNVLKRFSDIHIEYHYGYRDLKEKLEKSGFNVSVTKPARNLSRMNKQYVGHIYAKRNLYIAA
jgi:FkbM family methyltransferase